MTYDKAPPRRIIMRYLFSVLLIPVATGLWIASTPPPAGELLAEEEFLIFVTGADEGILEPCGCTGGQLGGIGRRDTLIRGIAPGGQPRLTLSIGGVAGGTDLLHLIRFEIILLCLAEMEYDALGLGPEELALGLTRLRSARELVEFPFLLTNVTFPEDGEAPPFETHLVKEAAGRRVLVTAIIPEALKNKLPEGARFSDPVDALAKVREAAGPVDLTVVLLRGDREEAKMLDRAVFGTDVRSGDEGGVETKAAGASPGADNSGGGDSISPRLILHAALHSEPQIYEFGKREGLIRYISPGGRGRFLVWLRMVTGPAGTLEPEPPTEEPLLGEYEESEDILIYMEWYRDRVIDENVLAGMVGRKDPPPGAPYLGNETCYLCHKQACATWDESGHAHALETLINAERDFDPECLSCHVVGFGFRTGFMSIEDTLHLADVGCESCHGPCGEHVASAGRTPTPEQVSCEICHNLDHSSGFDRDEYWPKIACRRDAPRRYENPEGKDKSARDGQDPERGVGVEEKARIDEGRDPSSEPVKQRKDDHGKRD